MITPKEAAVVNDALEKQAMVDMEKIIDAQLQARYRSGRSVDIDAVRIEAVDGWTSRAQELVISSYRVNGWNAKKYNQPQRGGASSYWTFTATKDVVPVSIEDLK